MRALQSSATRLEDIKTTPHNQALGQETSLRVMIQSSPGGGSLPHRVEWVAGLLTEILNDEAMKEDFDQVKKALTPVNELHRLVERDNFKSTEVGKKVTQALQALGTGGSETLEGARVQLRKIRDKPSVSSITTSGSSGGRFKHTHIHVHVRVYISMYTFAQWW